MTTVEVVTYVALTMCEIGNLRTLQNHQLEIEHIITVYRNCTSLDQHSHTHKHAGRTNEHHSNLVLTLPFRVQLWYTFSTIEMKDIGN